jgi:uncharacterized protein (DUF2236 family)
MTSRTSVLISATVTARRKNNALQNIFARRFSAFLSADPSGVPPWLPKIEQGNGPGFFTPEDAPWVIHADLATLVGGVRALLIQALHPGSLTGVYQHSRYHEDPLGRLAGTIQWLTITTFASRESIEKEAARVRGMHQRVRGTYETSSGEKRAYQAADPDLMLWVHIAFMDSFLRCHQQYSANPIPGGADAYVRLWAKSVEPLGLTEGIPTNEKELLEAIDHFRPSLAVTEKTREVIHWLKSPPLPPLARVVYALLFQAALITLPEDMQRMICQRSAPGWLIRPATRGFLRFLRVLIGPQNKLADAALDRIHRTSRLSASAAV